MVHADDRVGGGSGPRGIDVLDEAPFPPRSPDPVHTHRELSELPLPALRHRRRLLAEEVARVRHWSRLVRARRDLLVAAAVPLDDLAVPVEAGAHGGPLEHHFAPALDADAVPAGPTPEEADPGHALRGLVLVAGATGRGELAAQLRELAAAGRRLSGYEHALAAELVLATDVLAERCADLFGASPL